MCPSTTRLATHSSVPALARLQQEKAERAALADRLAADFAPSLPRPVTTAVFELAWEYGHANGETEVEIHYVDLVQVALQAFLAGKAAVTDGALQ